MPESNGFSQNAPLYASSPAHAETGDLELALSLLGEVEGLEMLDVATGTGHTAFFFADLDAHVFGVDINDEMLAVAQEESDRQSLSCRFLKGPADDLPFDDGQFDLIATRLAAHHFQAPGDFLAEARRVLRLGGRILIIDNIVPEGDAGTWINGYERSRDPSHVACLTESRWKALLQEHGFANLETRRYPKDLDYTLWIRRMSLEGHEADRLWQTLQTAPAEVIDHLRPREDEAGPRLTLHRLIVVACKA